MSIITFNWQISVEKDQFNSIEAANNSIYIAVPGVRGEISDSEVGNRYHFAVTSTERDRQAIADALTEAGIPAKVEPLESE